jgi:hypothetical protein
MNLPASAGSYSVPTSVPVVIDSSIGGKSMSSAGTLFVMNA